MKRTARTFCFLTDLCCLASLCQGQDTARSHEHLQFLDPLVGNWRVVTREGNKIVSDGQETSEWILKQNFLRSTGWSQYRGRQAEYEFCTGWNPKTNEVFQWAAGATDSVYSFMWRTGVYDPATRTWTAHQRTALSDGLEEGTVKISLAEADKVRIDFLENRFNGKAMPDQYDTFTRAEPVAAPGLDANPGPGYEHIKFLAFSIGKWKLEGDLPDGLYTGEEVNEWFLDKNFIRTKGWGQEAGQERVDYELLTGWDPAAKKVLMRYIGSDGQLATREGTYDAAKNCLTSKHAAVDASGVESTATVVEQYLDNDRFLLKFTDVTEAGKPQPDFQAKATRAGP
ncbi:MAG: DUF1579 family protein [Thermoguttaceae bacterium]